ncbi:hypothetical protein evm_013929 [Chilo suppressalis]|nr:hypothetical protein evm_013929 [Chilo suppressalis]
MNVANIYLFIYLLLVAYASVLSNSIPKRKETITTGVTSIIDFIDTLFNDNEGTALFKALDLVNEFPNTTENAYDILRTLSGALFAPYLRWSGTLKAQILINSINNEITRAHGKSVVGRENIYRDGEMKDQRRLGIFTNRTRFVVVDREMSDTDDKSKIKTINKDKHRKNSLEKVDVKRKHDSKKEFDNVISDDVYEKTTTEYNPFKKHIARFQIVTREADVPKHKPHLFIQTMKYEEYTHLNEKHPKMYDKHTKNLKKKVKAADFKLTDVFKNIYKDFISFSRNITVKRHPIFTKRPTRRTAQYKPKYTKETRFSTPPKQLKTYSYFNSKSEEDNRDLTKRKTTNGRLPYNKTPIRNVILANKLGINTPKRTERKIHKKQNKRIIEPKYTELYGSDFKSNKKTDERKQIRYYNTALNEVTEPSSYSYEENDLKFRLHDALNHDAVYDNLFRKHNDNSAIERSGNQLSSYSSEEATIKSNIYQVIGFNHVARNASFDGVPQRRTNVSKNIFTKGVKFKPVNVLSSYEDEEGVIKERLYD